MKPTIYSISLLAILLGFLTIPGHSQERKKIRTKSPSMKGLVFRNAATHSELSQKLRIANKDKPMAQFEVKELKEDPTKKSTPKDFIKQSDILCLSGNATFVPKRAVLNVPERFNDRFILKKGSKIMTFPAFYAKNRGWIMTYEVSIDQAFGKKPFDESKLEWLKKSGRVVVATFKGGPITVLPFVDEEEEERKKAEEEKAKNEPN